MKIKTFIILIGICGILAGAAYFISQPKTPVQKDRTGEKLLANLPINNVTAISIKDSEKQVNLAKGSLVWGVKDRFNYPADFGNITEFAKKLMDMKIGRSFNADKDIRTRLGLWKPDEKNAPKDAAGTSVIFKDKSNKILLDMIIGKPREASAGSGGHYVMMAGQPNVYLVDKDFKYIEKEPSDWLDKKILDVPSEKVRRIVCYNPVMQKELYALERSGKDNEPKFINPPEGKQIIQAKLRGAFGAISGFNIDDIADPKTSTDKTGFDNALCFKYYLFDGTIYTFCTGRELADNKNQHYFKAEAAYLAPPEEKLEKKEEVAEKPDSSPKPDTKISDDKKPAEKTPEKLDTKKLAADANAMNKKLSRWIFIAPKWKVSHMITDIQEFFEKPKAAEEAKEE